MGEIVEIESISKDLAQKEIYIASKVLQKAIIYDNQRELLKTLGKKVVEGVVIEETPEFLV